MYLLENKLKIATCWECSTNIRDFSCGFVMARCLALVPVFIFFIPILVFMFCIHLRTLVSLINVRHLILKLVNMPGANSKFTPDWKKTTTRYKFMLTNNFQQWQAHVSSTSFLSPTFVHVTKTSRYINRDNSNVAKAIRVMLRVE